MFEHTLPCLRPKRLVMVLLHQMAVLIYNYMGTGAGWKHGYLCVIPLPCASPKVFFSFTNSCLVEHVSISQAKLQILNQLQTLARSILPPPIVCPPQRQAPPVSHTTVFIPCKLVHLDAPNRYFKSRVDLSH